MDLFGLIVIIIVVVIGGDGSLCFSASQWEEGQGLIYPFLTLLLSSYIPHLHHILCSNNDAGHAIL